MKPTEFIRLIVDLARAANRSRPQSTSGIDLSELTVEALRKTDEEIALKQAFDGRHSALIYACLAVMYIGRGDMNESEPFLDTYTMVSNRFNKPKYAINQMLEKVPLPDYLENGLMAIKRRGINVDELIGDGDIG